jgi:limonene-1,2-epoxide hydrolase
MPEPIDVVQQFCDSWGTPDEIEGSLALLADDCVYHNIPVDPVVGIEAIREFIKGFAAGVERVDFATNAIAANGSTVLTERVDTFRYPGKQIDLPVMGTFEVNADGKISAWRDYFDLNQFMSQMG